MFVSRPKVLHGNNLLTSTTSMTTDHRVRVKASVVASNTHTITTHTSDVTSVAFSRTTLATCSADKSVRLWNVKDFSELPVSPLLGHTFPIHCCSFSPLGSILATCSTDGTLRLWDVKSGEEVAVLMHPSKNAIRVCQFSCDGTMMITGGDDDLACLWNLADKKLIRTLQGHEETVTSAAFSPDGNYTVTGSSGGDYGGELLVWDAQYGHGRPLARVNECHDLGVSCCQFSPTHGVDKAGSAASDNSKKQFLLATGGKDNLVKLWILDCVVGSLKTSVKLKTMLPGHTDSVLWLCFTLDGISLASSSLDKTVRLWNVDTEQTLLVLDSHTRYVSSCAFSSDGKNLATASGDNTLKIWQLSDTSSIMDGLNGYEDVDSADSPFSQVAMETWSVEDVCHWLDWLGLAEYEGNFRNNAIDGKELLGLTAADLEHSLGVGALGHRNKILRSRTASQQQPITTCGKDGENIPEEFVCPISHELMKDPVIACDGYTYDRPAITAWMAKGEARSPMTNILLPSNTLTPNRTLKMMIQKFLQLS